MKKNTIIRSRKSFFVGYLFVLAFSLILFSLYNKNIVSGFILYLLSFPSIYLFLLPEYIKIHNKYFIKESNIEEISGIIIKKKNIIPWNLVSNVTMKKGILGTMLGYGDITVSTMTGKGNITIKGVNNPEKVLRKIEEKIGRNIDN